MTARVKAILTLTDTLRRVWSDPRLDEPHARRTREFLNAWFITQYSVTNHDEAFTETLRRIGADRRYGWYGIVHEDIPRYRPPDWHVWRCQAPKTRGANTGQPCGRSAGHRVRVTDPTTGEWTMGAWCTAHADYARIMKAREAALTDVPEPRPNSGGLLPSYIRASNWPDLYRWTDPRWTPPYVGIIADDWPVLVKAIEPPRTGSATPPDADDSCGPALRLIKGGAR